MMNKKEKLQRRFRSLPRDFTFEEMALLFKGCGFELGNKGATSGSRVEFVNEHDNKNLHYAQASPCKHREKVCNEASV